MCILSVLVIVFGQKNDSDVVDANRALTSESTNIMIKLTE